MVEVCPKKSETNLHGSFNWKDEEPHKKSSTPSNSKFDEIEYHKTETAGSYGSVDISFSTETSLTKMEFFNSSEFDEESDPDSSLPESMLEPRRFVQFRDSLSDLDADSAFWNNPQGPLEVVSVRAGRNAESSLNEVDWNQIIRSKSESCLNTTMVPKIEGSSGDDIFDWANYYVPEEDAEIFPYLENLDSDNNTIDLDLESWYPLRYSISLPARLNRKSKKKFTKLQRYSHTCSLPNLYYDDSCNG